MVLGSPQSPKERVWGGCIHVRPSRSRPILEENLWQPYFPEVAIFTQIREALRLFPTLVETQRCTTLASFQPWGLSGSPLSQIPAAWHSKDLCLGHCVWVTSLLSALQDVV